jgi:hypothetical protein
VRGHHLQRWTDGQVLTILRATHADVPAVADRLGMSVAVAYKYRSSHSKRAMVMRDEYGLPRIVGGPALDRMKASTMIRRAIRGEHV